MRRPLLLLAAMLTLLPGLTACPNENCIIRSPTPTQRAGLFLVNEQVSLPLATVFEDICGENLDAVTPTGFSAEIHDPDQLPVEHQATLANPARLGGRLEFTPRKPGRYHIFAAFEPVGGIHQFDVYAAMNRSTEVPLQTLPRECTSLERTRSGTFVCDLDFYRDGIPVRQFPSGRMATAGDAVWRVDLNEISRYVDTGAAMKFTGSLGHTAGLPEAILATETELVVLHANRIQRFVFDGQTLTRTGDSLWDTPTQTLNSEGLRGVMVRTGDRLAVITSVFANGGSRLQACPFQLNQGRFLRTGELCDALPGVVVGFEPSVLWVAEQVPNQFAGQTLHRMEWTGTQWLRRGTLELGQVLRLPFNPNLRRPTVVPVLESPHDLSSSVFHSAVPVYVPNQAQLRLDSLDRDALRTQASSSLFWGATLQFGGAGSTSRIRLRPSTP